MIRTISALMLALFAVTFFASAPTMAREAGEHARGEGHRGRP